MKKKIIILAIPGIGTQGVGFSEKFENRLKKFSENTSLENNFRIIECRPFSVANIDKNQETLFERLDKANKLGGKLSVRKFVMEAFGDGVTFERNPTGRNSSYKRIHNYLQKSIEDANQLMQEYDKAKLVIVAASMGAHLLSTYIWDADNNKGIFKQTPATKNNNLENLSYFITIGCNIPLFISGFNKDQIVSFDKNKRNNDFSWDNYYDRDDILGWPLQQLSDSYNNIVTDHEVNTGLYVGSHVKYWKRRSVTKPITKKLVTLYDSM